MGCAFLSLPLSLGASYERNAREASCHAPSQPTTPLRNGPWCHVCAQRPLHGGAGLPPRLLPATRLPPRRPACIASCVQAAWILGISGGAPAGRAIRSSISRISRQAHQHHAELTPYILSDGNLRHRLRQFLRESRCLIAVLPSPAVRRSASQRRSRRSCSCQPKYQGW